MFKSKQIARTETKNAEIIFKPNIPLKSNPVKEFRAPPKRQINE